MTRIYWDTMLFIHLLEDKGPLGARAGVIQEAMQERGDQLCTSVFTLGELLVQPIRLGLVQTATRIREVMRSPEVEVVPFSEDVAEQFALIRAQFTISAADAIHVATAARARVNLFLTNDQRLRRLHVPGIDFIAPLDAELF
ncbi:MAG: type II toxin-antitoxin system VapC family toxin [Terriglobales bacterium]